MYDMTTLSNGLRLVIEKIDYVNSVSVGLWIENGSRNEDCSNNGISHFIEHMLFKGTKTRNAKELAEAIEDVGGQINAFTGKEATCFYIKVLDTHLPLSIEVLADMLFNSTFLDEDIEREKGVVIEEINMSEDTPEDVVNELHHKVIWGNDSLSLPILGTVETVKRFNRNQILEYIQSYYIPENSVISICGNVDVKEAEILVENYFRNWKSEYKKITNYSSPSILKGSISKTKKIEQLHISLGMKGIPMGNDDIYPLLLLNNILGGGVSSLLFQKVREELGLCYTIYSYLSTYKNTGIINIYTGLNANYASEALEMINEELSCFAKQEIDEIKLTKAKEQIKGNYILGLESTSSRMFSNGKSALFLNRINRPDEVIKKIDKISIENLNNIMNKTFALGIMNSAYVGNKMKVNEYDKILQINQVAFNNKIGNKLV